MGKKQKPCFTGHARDRAFERYGFDIPPAQMREIFDACISGKALLGRTSQSGHTYMYRLASDKLVVPVLVADKSFIVTFMPADFFASGNSLEFHKRKGSAKQRQTRSHFPSHEDYKRERITVRQALEEL